MKRVILHKERDFSLRHRHPWVLSGAVNRVEGGDPEAGETVAVLGGDGAPLALGAWSGASQIRIRAWTFDPEETVDAAFFGRRVQAALDARRRLDTLAPGGAGRILNAESDGLPGITVDRYADFLVVQLTSAGAERHRNAILEALRSRVPCRGIYERSDSATLAAYECLPPHCGTAWGEDPPPLIEIREDDRRYWVDVRRGHKTGFYLDQRANRDLVSRYAAGADALNAFSYTGGFGIAAALGGARHVTHVELSTDALSLARRNLELNGLPADAHTFEEANVFEYLRECRDRGASFDLVVLDPPKFADSRGTVMKASRGYKDIALLGIKLLRPGGILATFSCSSHVDPALFWKITAAAAVDSRRSLRVLHRLSAAPDHCVSPDFPQGEYLKGFLCAVV